MKFVYCRDTHGRHTLQAIHPLLLNDRTSNVLGKLMFLLVAATATTAPVNALSSSTQHSLNKGKATQSPTQKSIAASAGADRKALPTPAGSTRTECSHPGG
eukprot:GHVQ01028252.1.p1 GENE.GHVQ01028252.1~~GHVQ01028252.1.p1  ORF type:complete len:101 (-),score=11.60 GHVQ01028252.1:26-328(-)